MITVQISKRPFRPTKKRVIYLAAVHPQMVLHLPMMIQGKEETLQAMSLMALPGKQFNSTTPPVYVRVLA